MDRWTRLHLMAAVVLAGYRARGLDELVSDEQAAKWAADEAFALEAQLKAAKESEEESEEVYQEMAKSLRKKNKKKRRKEGN